MLFMMFSNQIHSFTQYMSLGEQVRMIGQSGRFPTQQLVDTYEMKNGKRIDETGSGYDPKKPFDSRDPRLKKQFTLIMMLSSEILGETTK